LSIENPQILEIACGCGQFANLLFDREYFDYFSFDFSPVAIKRAKIINPKQAGKFIIGDALTADMAEHDYNTVIIFKALEHIQEDLLLLSKIKTDSNVFISVPNYPSESHVRWLLSENEIIERYGKLLDIRKVVQAEISATGNVIFLIHAFKR
jgi:2-polyprenyl-3-methyl-5-hydroxy-6-metoxy-1,4-benzoquinol methylase